MKPIADGRFERSRPDPILPPLKSIINERKRFFDELLFSVLLLYLSKFQKINLSVITNSSGRFGLECESGEYDDCFEEDTNSDDRLPSGCEQVLIFSESKRTCGSKCNLQTNRQSQQAVLKEGWTLYIRFERIILLSIYDLFLYVLQTYQHNELSVDEPTGTGDHENYFVDDSNVYELDGKTYTNCIKKAIHIRSIDKHISWWNLRGYSFIFSRRSKFYWSVKTTQIEYTTSLNAYYG